jgi:saccharopine dehydrogenase-like NADP-dependent oxidoreductase
MGGTGAVGQYIVEELLLSPLPFQVTIAGRSEARFEKLFSEDIPDLDFKRVDLQSSLSIDPLLEGQKLLILAAGSFRNFTSRIALAAADRGVHYIDICNDPDYSSQLHDHSEALENSGKVFLTGISCLPEISLRLADSVRSRLDTIEDISIGLFMGSKNLKTPGAMTSVMSNLNQDATFITDGEPQPSLKSKFRKTFTFPEPTGQVPAFAWNSSDFISFPQLFQFNNLVVRVGFEGHLTRRIFSTFKQILHSGNSGFLETWVRSTLACLQVFNRGGTERSCVTVQLEGLKNGQRKCIRVSAIANEKGHRLAALPAVIAAEAIMENKDIPHGLVQPLSWLPTDVFLNRLTQYGLEYQVEENDY